MDGADVYALLDESYRYYKYWEKFFGGIEIVAIWDCREPAGIGTYQAIFVWNYTSLGKGVTCGIATPTNATAYDIRNRHITESEYIACSEVVKQQGEVLNLRRLNHTEWETPCD